jgi:hypothetical protein
MAQSKPTKPNANDHSGISAVSALVRHKRSQSLMASSFAMTSSHTRRPGYWIIALEKITVARQRLAKKLGPVAGAATVRRLPAQQLSLAERIQPKALCSSASQDGPRPLFWKRTFFSIDVFDQH